MDEFIPKNDLERVLADAHVGLVSTADFIKVFLKSDIAIPSKTEVLQDSSGFQPLFFNKEAKSLLGCFTDMDRIGDVAKHAPYCMVMKGKEFLDWLPKEYGIVVNPGYTACVEISPEGIASILADYRS